MVTPFDALPLFYPSAYIKKIWRGIVYDSLDKEEIQPNDGKSWVTIASMDCGLQIRIKDIARLLFAKEEEILQKLSIITTREKLIYALHHRFLTPPLDRLKELLLKKYPINRHNDYYVEITKKIESTYTSSLFNLEQATQENTSAHLTRIQAGTPLPIEISENGQFWAILKIHSRAAPVDFGEFKKVYHAVNLHTFQLAIWGKANIRSRHSRSLQEIKADVIAEISIQQLLEGPEFVKIYHHVFYKNRHGLEKVGIMMECCDGNLETLIQRRWDPACQVNLSQTFWNILEDVLSALAKLEQKKIHHRDLKSDNIFYVETENGTRGKLGDFGFAIHTAQEKTNPMHLGSPLYTAPEFQKGHRKIAEGNELIKKGANSLKISNHYDVCAKSCLEVINKIKPDDSFKTTRIAEAKKIYNIHLEKCKQYETLSQEQMRQGEQLLNEGSELAANTKGDLWALGLVLYHMRTGKDPLTLFTDKPESQVETVQFFRILMDLQQFEVNVHFPKPCPKNSLAALNLSLLTIDPNQRPTAQPIYEAIKDLRKDGASFS